MPLFNPPGISSTGGTLTGPLTGTTTTFNGASQSVLGAEKIIAAKNRIFDAAPDWTTNGSWSWTGTSWQNSPGNGALTALVDAYISGSSLPHQYFQVTMNVTTVTVGQIWVYYNYSVPIGDFGKCFIKNDPNDTYELPVGTYDVMTYIDGNGTTGGIWVSPTGDVAAWHGAINSISLKPITFPAGLTGQEITSANNSGFSAPIDWTGTNWAIAGGYTFEYTGTGGEPALLDVPYFNAAPVPGTIYQITFSTTAVTPGTLTIGFGGAVSAPMQVTHNFTFAVTLTAVDNTTGLSITPTAWQGAISYVNVRILTLSESTITTYSDGFLGIQTRTTFHDNVGVGPQALSSYPMGSCNTAFGCAALKFVTTGEGNTAFGDDALTNTLTGIENVAIGREAIESNTSGNYNVGVGSRALQFITGSQKNVAIGHETLRYLTIGDGNISLGYKANESITVGTYNVALGAYSSTQNFDYSIVLGRGAQATGSNQARFGSAAYTTSTYLYGQLYVNDAVADNAIMGSSIIDFGGAPGTNQVELVVTGLTSITANSVPKAWLNYEASPSHTADEHLLLNQFMSVMAGNVVPGVGFTIYAVTPYLRTSGEFVVRWTY